MFIATESLRGLPLEALDEYLDGAECLYDPELHDGPADEESPEDQAAREEIAKQLCASCPVLAQCELYTARVRPDFGVWAGRSAAERLLDDLLLVPLLGGIPRQGKSSAVNQLALIAADVA